MTIKTKYSIGETLWSIHPFSDKALECIVWEIDIKVVSDDQSETYYVYYPHNKTSMYPKSKEQLYPTKQSLLKSL
jgi:protein associated with RNAse G/E